MTAITRVSGGLSVPGKILGAVLLALFLSALAVIVVPSVARADEPATIEYSSDGGTTWGGTEKISWNNGLLVPGEELKTSFKVRNASGVAGWVGFAVGEYEVSPDMIASVRVDVDGTAGTPVTLTDGGAVAPLTEIGRVHLAPGAVASIDLVSGMPADAGNQAQDGTVNPRWSVGFTPGELPDPGCVPSGSLGSLSCLFAGAGSSGSLAS
ncbi:hypothetical protein [Prescottella equi]|uniref:hypothetical protein n=1 Tax=Rhodococcus hoagii TaxID=43767 RepID=UPI0019DB4769|nr:hypothetical protein [Prescottella equi]MBM4468037.1 hypothetical protein [Prescottella equi]MBM4468794.1 hypothetical protein [Prescottella equi]MBM4468808.1 hypothetical protein [Prescottella equi]MBM4476062.1 hypothetical protein [Prescottella equi]NKT13753.1 hypothetical protein [Prescottella equi]